MAPPASPAAARINMPVIVNGVELSDADLEQQLPHHGDAANPQRRAITALVLRRVLLDEAWRLGLPADSDEAAIGALLDTQAATPEPDDAACRRHYAMHPERFTVGELVEADHILFQEIGRATCRESVGQYV